MSKAKGLEQEKDSNYQYELTWSRDPRIINHDKLLRNQVELDWEAQNQVYSDLAYLYKACLSLLVSHRKKFPVQIFSFSTRDQVEFCYQDGSMSSYLDPLPSKISIAGKNYLKNTQPFKVSGNCSTGIRQLRNIY